MTDDGTNYKLTAPGPDCYLLLWKAQTDENSFCTGWSQIAEVRAEFGDDHPPYDVCPYATSPSNQSNTNTQPSSATVTGSGPNLRGPLTPLLSASFVPMEFSFEPTYRQTLTWRCFMSTSRWSLSLHSSTTPRERSKTSSISS